MNYVDQKFLEIYNEMTNQSDITNPNAWDLSLLIEKYLEILEDAMKSKVNPLDLKFLGYDGGIAFMVKEACIYMILHRNLENEELLFAVKACPASLLREDFKKQGRVGTENFLEIYRFSN